MPGEFLDVSSDPGDDEPQSTQPAGASRKYLGVQFRCCGVYSRVYINRPGDAYEGRCPRCAKRVRFEIGPGGSEERFFTVG